MKAEKMAPVERSWTSCQRAAMERFGNGGMALLPWTRQLLAVVWEQLRLLVHVIYYTFLSVFQQFRFEFHLRITDETGLQHMNTSTNPSDSFIFSSLFDGNSGVMVGDSTPLSNFCAEVVDPFGGKSPAEAILSSLRSDDLCCGLVDDFVSRSAGKDEGIFLESSWNVGFPGDWNIFLSGSSDGRQMGGEKVFGREKVFWQDTSEEERSSQWSNEEDQGVAEFDSEESKALWESLSRSSDPYNPFFFSACTSTNANTGKGKSEAKDAGAAAERHGPTAPVRRSDSEISWTSSDCSGADFDEEESDRLLELFSCPDDPYNPMCFTACTDSGKPRSSESDLDGEDRESRSSFSFDDDEDERLWNSLCHLDDPYHPLNFQACLRGSGGPARPPDTCSKTPRNPRRPKPVLPDRKIKRHSHRKVTRLAWKKPQQAAQSPADERKETTDTTSSKKKVRFSPVVQVHTMRTWPFARAASRKGPWEQMARDRDRFRRRIQDAEGTVGRCLDPAHRQAVRANLGLG